MCVSGHEKVYDFSVSIERGWYHMVGVARVTIYHSSGEFAALYSHTTGWNRHRGSALPVGSGRALGMFHRPCLSEGGDNFLGEMLWRAAWDRVYTESTFSLG